MKETTVHSLVIARTLLERADPLCASEDRYLASSGLVILQDALEAIVYALLIELGIDETKNIESQSFDGLIGELKKADVPVPKSGTMKALNKQRVLTKHYAQVAEPTMVRNYHSAAHQVIDSLMHSVLGKSIYQLFISSVLQDSESKEYLEYAEIAINDEQYLDALIEIRKAIFIEFENDYNIVNWEDFDSERPGGLLVAGLLGGLDAPFYTRNPEWIKQNVITPIDYIQIDHENLRLQAIEYGIHTMELENIRRLTPDVFRRRKGDDWSVQYNANFPENNATELNALYCLDRAVWIIQKKQEHRSIRRTPSNDHIFSPPPIYEGHILYKKPTKSSEQVHIVQEGYTYRIVMIVGGFVPTERYYKVIAESKEKRAEGILGPIPVHTYRGYLEIIDEDSD